MILFLLFLTQICEVFAKKPIVIVSGMFGAALDAKLTHAPEPHPWCFHNKDWFWLWMNINDLIPWLTTECLQHNIELHFNATSQTYYNNPGVQIRPHDWGGTEGIEYINPILKKKAEVWMTFVKYFVDNLGYKRSFDIVGAPLDWRLGTKGMGKQGYMTRLKELCESTYEANNGSKISIVSLSEGGPTVQTFLVSYVTQEWKDKYILNFISISGAFDGVREVLPIAIKGKGLGLPISLNPCGKSFGGLPLVIPLKTYVDVPLIIHGEDKYYPTYESLEKLYTKLNWKEGWEVFNYEYTVDTTIPPNVTTHCLIGTNLKAVKTVEFKKLDNFEDYTVVEYCENGDGLVCDESLNVCGSWKGKQKYDVKNYFFEGLAHRDLPQKKDVILAAVKILYPDYVEKKN